MYLPSVQLKISRQFYYNFHVHVSWANRHFNDVHCHQRWVVASLVLSSFSLLMLPFIDFKTFDPHDQSFPCFSGNEGIVCVILSVFMIKAASLASISAEDWCTKSTVMAFRIVNRDRIFDYQIFWQIRLGFFFVFRIAMCINPPMMK